MRRFRGRRRLAKRTTAWIPGVTSYDAVAGVSNRLVALTTAGFTTANLWGSAIVLVANSDLPARGGEGAVLTRVVGRLGFTDGRRDAGAGNAAAGFQMRVAITLGNEIAGTATILGDELVTSAGMGLENILFSRDVIVSPTGIGAAGAGFDTMFTAGPFWQCDVDVRAKRRITEDTPVILWFQTTLPAGTVGADFRLLGGLRTLLMRAR